MARPRYGKLGAVPGLIIVIFEQRPLFLLLIHSWSLGSVCAIIK